MAKTISIIIPAYNEAKEIVATVRAVADFFRSPEWTSEIIVVDDGSNDKTASLAAQAGARVLRQPVNRGKGASVKTGALAATGELILITDVDLSTPLSELPNLLTALINAEIAIGSRALPTSLIEKRQNWLKTLLGKLGNKLIRLILNLPWQDTQCGFKLFRSSTKQIFQQQRLNRWGFDFELLYLAKKAGYRVQEVGVRWRHDPDSRVKPLDYFKTLSEVFLVRWHDWRGHYQI